MDNRIIRRHLPIIAVLIVFAALNIPEKVHAYEYKTFTVRPNTFGCKNEEDYKRLSKLAGDLQALDKFIRQSVVSGACRWLPVGEQAIIERYGVLSSSAKVRIKGETQTFWIPQKSMEE